MDILLVRIGRLGDMVMIGPALQEITALYPEARLHLITSPDGCRLFKKFGIKLDRILVCRQPFYQRIFDEFKIKNFIKQNHFDKIFCFEEKERTRQWLPPSAHIIPKNSSIKHYAKRCLELVNPHATHLNLIHYLPFTCNQESLFKASLESMNISADTLLIGFHPTYSGFNKYRHRNDAIHRIWPWENFAALAIKLKNWAHDKKIPIIILMNLLPEEECIGHQIEKASHGAVRLVPLGGDFESYLLFLQRLNLLLVANTGVMHLAAGLNTPLIALFSQLSPDDCGPYMPKENYRVLRAEDSLYPEQGLAAIGVEEVFSSIISQLSRTA